MDRERVIVAVFDDIPIDITTGSLGSIPPGPLATALRARRGAGATAVAGLDPAASGLHRGSQRGIDARGLEEAQIPSRAAAMGAAQTAGGVGECLEVGQAQRHAAAGEAGGAATVHLGAGLAGGPDDEGAPAVAAVDRGGHDLRSRVREGATVAQRDGVAQHRRCVGGPGSARRALDQNR